jgi:hypothetical protein
VGLSTSVGFSAGACVGCGAGVAGAAPPQAVSTRLAITRIAAHIQIVLLTFNIFLLLD